MTETALIFGPFGRVLSTRVRSSLVAHAHPEPQIIFHAGGRNVTLQVNGEVLQLSENTVALYNPWDTHAILGMEGESISMISVLLSPEWMRGQWASRFDVTRPFRAPLALLNGEMKELLRSLSGDVVERDRRCEDHCQDTICQLIGLIFEREGRLSGKPAASSDAKPVDYRIKRALQFIQTNAIGKINIDEIASTAGMSRAQFYRRFKACVGASPLHVVDSMRMAWAVAHLTKTSQPIAELSDELGFSMPATFSHFFAAHTGISPREYRNRFRDLVSARNRDAAHS